MKILIASVYTEKSLKWQEIQSSFIKNNTTSDYDHVIFYHGDKKDFINIKCESTCPLEQHVYGIQKILHMFRNLSSYTHCLILDSDAFPIKKGWDIEISSIMKLHSCSISCPIRFENLDTFYHPCTIFISGNDINVDVGIKPIANLLDYRCNEVIVESSEKIFPLIKTNFLNPHPMISSIYFNMFYHHGFGSRNFYCRSVHINNYYEEHKLLNNFDNLTKNIFENPKSFINKILGKKLV